MVVDLDVSGKSIAGRRGFQTLVEGVKAGHVDVVAMYDQSRAFRSTRDAIEFYVLIEQRPAVNVVFVHCNFDRSPAGEFTYTALAAAHALERRMVAEKMRDALRYRQSRGEMVGAVPFGYRCTIDGTVRGTKPLRRLSNASSGSTPLAPEHHVTRLAGSTLTGS